MTRGTRNWIVRHPVECVLYGAGLGVALVALIFGLAWASSRPPDPRVYEGKVSERVFVPAHERTWMMQQYAGQTCTKIGNVNSCTPNYIYVPMTERIADAWFLKVKGCKRREDDSPVQYCQKQGTRSLRVGEAAYMATKVGDEWHDPHLDRT